MKRFIAIMASLVMFVAMAVPAFAADKDDYAKSVTAQPAPGIVVDGDVIGYVVDENGEVISEIKVGEVVITPYSLRKTLPEAEMIAMEDVYKKIENGEMVYPTELIDALGGEPVAQELFNVTVPEAKILDYLKNNRSIRITLDTNFDNEESVMVASFVDGQWVMAEECVLNDDGTLTVTLSEVGTVAVFVKGDAPVSGDAEPGVDGTCKVCHAFFPYLGAAPIFDGVCIICFVLIVVLVIAGGYIVYRAKQKKEESK